MRIYEEGSREKLSAVICNQCGKKMKVENGILMEGCCHVETPFSYFSQKDGHRYLFDLCEECYDRIIAEFSVPDQGGNRAALTGISCLRYREVLCSIFVCLVPEA